MSKQLDALREYFDKHAIRNKEIAEALGMRPSSVSNLLAGRDSLGSKRAKRLCEVFGFDYVYLMTGEGTLFGTASAGTTQNNMVTTNNGTISQNGCPDAAELLRRIGELTAERDAARKEAEWLRQLVDRLAPSEAR